MGWYTDLFIADPSEAAAIADPDSSWSDWPHLSLKSVGDSELRALWSAVRGTADGLPDVTGDLYYPDDYAGEEDCTLIFGLSAGFVRDVAGIPDDDRDRVAKAWRASEELAEWRLKDARARLDELVEFTRRSLREKKPILQQSVL